MSDDNVHVHSFKPADDEVAELNKTYAVILLGSQCVVMKQGKTVDGGPTRSFMTVGNFEHWMENRVKLLSNAKGETKPVALAKYWLQHPQRREYDGIVFRPNQEVEGYFNLWTGFAVQPQPGCCDKFLAHIRDNVCRSNDEHYNWVIAFFADIAQNPGNKKGVSLVLRGASGIGKTKVAEVFGSLFGEHYISVSDPRYVTGRFNGHMLSCLLMCADEGFWAGDKKAEGRIKDLITGRTQAIELKGKESEWVDNHLRLLVIGNEEWLVPASMKERRWCVLDVGEDHIRDYDYFAAIDEEMNNGGRAALLHYLLNFDLTKVNLRKIPDTAALTEQKIASLTVNEQWWLDVLRRGELPHCTDDSCPIQSLHESYVRRTDNIGRYRKSTETELGMFLHKMVPKLHITRPRSNNARPRTYQFSTLKECREHFAKKMLRTDLAWDDQDEWEKDPGPSF